MMNDPLETARQNVYRLQQGGDRLCDALRKIAAGCDNPEVVARKALNHLERDPKNWDDVLP